LVKKAAMRNRCGFFRNFAALKLINNLSSKKSIVRVAAIQWEAKYFREHLSGFLAEAEGCIRAQSGLSPDFIVFPEYFSLCLAADFEAKDDRSLLLLLATLTEKIIENFSKWAIKYNTHLIAGSLPVLENGKLFNTTYLCFPDGKVASYQKTHLTPWEKYWDIVAGDKLPVFDTIFGKIGILICYDAEFPEAARILVDKGAKIIFVPYQTDSIHGHNRVAKCAAARAIENECYVVTSGVFGAMPTLSLVEYQYAQSGIYTPCDYFFPMNGILALATVNCAEAIYAELDLTLLERMHQSGGVRTRQDRRPDLYNNKKTNLLTIKTLTGAEILPYLADLARLRISVFAEFPYLYEGNEAYEINYLKTFIQSKNSVLVLVLDGEKVVGASTGLPISEETDNIQQPFLQKSQDVSKIFYFSESVLESAYRNRGLGVAFFQEREKWAKSLDYETCVFCSVVRSENHPLRPLNYQTLDGFWRKRGFIEMPDMTCFMDWKDKNEPEETTKSLNFWIKNNQI
jgi:predicted amidohydrolase/GNAT superfamily N-acetyltransferase